MTPKIPGILRILSVKVVYPLHTASDHEIISLVLAAQDSAQAADDLVRTYLPFIRAQTAKFLRRIANEEQDEEFSIAMFAFHEAAMAYQRTRGAFLPFAAKVIRSRLIDYQRRESRHAGHLSLDQSLDSQEDGTTLHDALPYSKDELDARFHRDATRQELAHFSEVLAALGLSFADISDNCPKQSRTLDACHRVLAYARRNPALLSQVETTGKLPMAALSQGSGVDRKTMERHRKYLVAILLAYTNGFEIIRGHLQQISPQKGG